LLNSERDNNNSTMTTPIQRAFILDIDGCLSKEGIPIPGSKSALQKLHSNQIPFVVCTNGGGQLESQRAARLSKTFDIPISSEQIILSYTPLQTEVVPKFKNDRVLIVGENCASVARAYGLSKAEGVREYCQRHSSLFPRRREVDRDVNIVDDSEDPVKAILFFEDPEDLGEALQLMTDVLLTNGNPSGPRVLLNRNVEQEVEVWFTNPDLVYSGLATHPRLTQGSFRLCLETLFQSATSVSSTSYSAELTTINSGRLLKAATVGKPTQLTGKTALSKLLQQCDSSLTEQHLEIWTVGDNPFSDVALANNMGWNSALVKTGIWKGDVSVLNGSALPTKIVDCLADLLQELNID
jgi:HAD superfamily hydrolase (TIGR01456 family)